METIENSNSADQITESQLPPHAIMMQFIHSKIICRCLSMAAEIGIADKLKNDEKPISALAEECDVNCDSLLRIIRALATVNIFSMSNEGQVQNTPLSETLISDAPGSLRSFARWVGTHLHWDTLAHLDHSLKTGKSALIRNEPNGDPFDVMSRDTTFQSIFNEAMTGISLADGVAIVDAYKFTDHASIMDVGGGKGALAEFIADGAPQSDVFVYDLPHVVKETKKRIEQTGSRIKVKEGSFFETVPGKVDLIVLKHILHDWDDDRSLVILKHCLNALNENGRILICEMLVNDQPEGVIAKLVDIDMMVGPGGKERTEEEFKTLLSKAGFRLDKIIPTQGPIYLLEAKKSQN